MLIRVGYELVFQVPARTPMLLMLYTHPSRAASLREADQVHVEPSVPIEGFTDPFGNRCGRLVAAPGKLRLWNMTSIEDSGEPDEVRASAQQQPVESLPPEVLPFLLGSRYCDVDRLTDVAWSLFGQTQLGWARVQAVCDWVHKNVQFGYQFRCPILMTPELVVHADWGSAPGVGTEPREEGRRRSRQLRWRRPVAAVLTDGASDPPLMRFAFVSGHASRAVSPAPCAEGIGDHNWPWYL